MAATFSVSHLSQKSTMVFLISSGMVTQMTATNFNLVLTSIDREPIYKIDQSFFVSLYWSFKIDRPIIWVLKKLTNPEEIKKTIVDFWDDDWLFALSGPVLDNNIVILAFIVDNRTSHFWYFFKVKKKYLNLFETNKIHGFFFFVLFCNFWHFLCLGLQQPH
jgi:hypothetical protein